MTNNTPLETITKFKSSKVFTNRKEPKPSDYKLFMYEYQTLPDNQKNLFKNSYQVKDYYNNKAIKFNKESYATQTEFYQSIRNNNKIKKEKEKDKRELEPIITNFKLKQLDTERKMTNNSSSQNFKISNNSNLASIKEINLKDHENNDDNDKQKEALFKDIELLSKSYLSSEAGNFTLKYDRSLNTFNKFNIQTKLKLNDMLKVIERFENDKHKDYTELIKKGNSNPFKQVYGENMETFYYNNPLTSLNQLQINQQIFSKTLNELIKYQIKSYDSAKDTIISNKEKLEKMKKVKSILTTKNKEDDSNVINDNMKAQLVELDNEKQSLAVLKHNYMYRDSVLSNIEMKGYFVNTTKQKPSARAEFTFILLEDTIFCFCGYNIERLLEVWCLDANTKEWTNLTVKNDTAVNPRMGHSTVYYRNHFYIFGGSIKIINKEGFSFIPKEDITLYRVKESIVPDEIRSRPFEFYVENCFNKFEGLWRRNHIAIAVGFHMFVYGGINEKEEFLDDCLFLDMQTFRWFRVKTEGQRPPPLAYMSACLAVISERTKYDTFSLFKLPELSNKSNVKKFKNEGIYIFGGLSETVVKDLPVSTVYNTMWCLKIGKKPPIWVPINVKGSGPCPRYGATMELFYEQSFLIVHGGKDDKRGDFIFKDTYIFDLLTYTWYPVSIRDSNPFPRALHGSVLHGKNLIIFGGMNDYYFHSSQLYIIDLNYSSKKLAQTTKEIKNTFTRENILSYERMNRIEEEGIQLINDNKEQTKAKNRKLGYSKYIRNIQKSIKKEIKLKLIERNKQQIEEEVEMKFGKMKSFQVIN